MENLTAKQKYLIAGGAVLLMVIGFIFLQFSKKDDIVVNQGNPVEETAEAGKAEDLQPVKPAEPKKIIIYVAGQVVSPGIIELNEGSRVNYALLKAGGITKFADIDQLNLAAQISDGEKVYIPRKGEKIADVSSKTQSGSGSGSSLININSASSTELDKIPGVGPSTAEKIIDYRKSKGSFKSIEDIKNVSGIGDKKFESIKKYITT